MPKFKPGTLGRLLAAQRERVPLVCVNPSCPRQGEPFQSYAGTLYCSSACRLAVYYEEHKAELNAARTARRRRKRGPQEEPPTAE